MCTKKKCCYTFDATTSFLRLEPITQLVYISLGSLQKTYFALINTVKVKLTMFLYHLSADL